MARLAWTLVSCALALSLAGCGFGVPLTYDDDSESGGESGASETDAGSETETGEPDTHPCGPTSGVVTLVIDGDTIELDSGERIRYLLVDTPETNPRDGVQCWGPQATDFNAEMVLGETVSLDYDAVCRDQYNRLLAYVTIDSRDDLEINRLLLEQGFACVLHIPPNGNDRVVEFQTLEDAAKQSEAGMWGSCATVACDF